MKQRKSIYLNWQCLPNHSPRKETESSSQVGTILTLGSAKNYILKKKPIIDIKKWNHKVLLCNNKEILGCL